MVYDCLCELHTFDEDKGVGKQPKDLNEARNQLENIGKSLHIKTREILWTVFTFVIFVIFALSKLNLNY